MMLVPGLIGALVGVHLFLVVKLGTTAPPWVRAARPKGARPTELVPAGVPAPEPGDPASANGASTNGAGTDAPAPEAPAEEPVAEGTDAPEASDADGEVNA
jgi:hypothetical protein